MIAWSSGVAVTPSLAAILLLSTVKGSANRPRRGRRQRSAVRRGIGHTLLIRRSVADPSEIEFFLAHAPDPTPIPELIAVAGKRWKIEENDGQGKDLLGLDQYQVRKWTPWTGT